MKLISLNLWGGIVGELLMLWLKEQSNDTDIFCFQEVFDAPNPPHKIGQNKVHFQLKKELSQLLPDFNIFYREHNFGLNMLDVVDFSLSSGLAIMIRKSFKDKFFDDEGDVMIAGAKYHRNPFLDRPSDRNLQYLRLKINDKILNILNYHGIWIKGAGKDDNEFRIEQSAKIIKFVQELGGETILVGDFNLEPDTESVGMIENVLPNNLIKSNNITSTRSSLYESIFEIKVGDQTIKNNGSKFADYAFVSDSVIVKSFEVPNLQISDHLPLIINFEFK